MSSWIINEDVKLKKRNVPKIIESYIIEQILNGKAKPGDKIPTEIEFTEKFGVSRNSVREGIKMLTTLGIIEYRRGTGTFISDKISDSALDPLVIQLAYSQRTPEELIELRIFFDTAIVELSLGRISEKDINDLEEINERLKTELEKTPIDSEYVSKIDLEFHLKCNELTHNSLLIKIGYVVYTLFFSTIRDSIIHAERMTPYQNHKKLIDSLRKKDDKEIRKIVGESLENWKLNQKRKIELI